MRSQHLLCAALVASGLLAACASESDRVRDRGDEIEKTYGLAPAEARAAAHAHPELATAEVEKIYQRVATALAMPRLASDDVDAFLHVALPASPERDALVDSLCSEDVVRLVSNLRTSLGYEPRFREASDLVAVSKTQATIAEAFAPGVRDAMERVRRRAPLARVPLVVVGPAMLLGKVPLARVEQTLERFGRLDVDLGVKELDPQSIFLLARCAEDPLRTNVLSALVRNLPTLQPRRVDPEALAMVAPVPSTALSLMLDRLGPTRTWRGFVGFNQAAASYLKALSVRPQAASLVSVLEDASEEFQCTGEVAEAQRLVRIDAAAPDGQAREALSAAFRARAVFARLDDATTELLIALVAKADLREAVTGLHSAFGQWHPTPGELSALQLLAPAAPNVGPVARSLRTLGYELAGRPLAKDEATSLADLAAANAQPLIDGLHVVLPRLVVKGSASLAELAALAKAGVTRDDVLRLDADSMAGTLDAARRERIVALVKKAG